MTTERAEQRDEQAHDHPADGTVVYLKAGMPGTYEGLSAVVHHRHPTSGHSNFPTLVWLETEVIWSHGTADGFWAARAEYTLSRPAGGDDRG